ncbi:hypothetical protein C8R44DRAFT_831788 [Mycena epipterygia]|nr:hypothetical protein C8R44DRAFT_831788 [Mycena epipterygia]
MFFSIKAVALSLLLAPISTVRAETHTITFTNECPTLMQGNAVISSGLEPVTIDGPLIGAIAFLQTGRCGGFGGLPGNGCGIVNTTLVNPSTAGSNSSTAISLIFPHAFNVVIGFEYFNGCDGRGANCTNDACPDALHGPTDTAPIITCDADNVDLAISFCALNLTIPTGEP